jgi:phosphohistidine phosphatase SixA
MTACPHPVVSVLRRRFCFSLVVCSVAFAARDSFAGTADFAWQDLARGGYVILLRHATTVPGTGDPPGYRLDDCATQRNLSEKGRAEAQQWAEMMALHRVQVARVFTSQWCRCVDTARLGFSEAAKTAPEIWPALNSFFDLPANEPQQTAAVKARLKNMNLRAQNVVLVTHQVNISAITGEAPAMGEAIVVRIAQDGRITRAGRLRAP